MKLAILASVLVCTALVGCAPATQMQWPPGFVEVNKENLGPYSERAVSADGVVVALRSEVNPKNATADFWATAVRDELVNRRGYALAKEEAITSAEGKAGKLMTFTAQRSGVEFIYLAAVYVSGEWVLVAEAGGKSESVTPKMEAIRKCLTGVRTAAL